MLRCVCKNWRCVYIKKFMMRLFKNFQRVCKNDTKKLTMRFTTKWRCIYKKLRCVYNKRIYSAIIRKIYGAFTNKSYGAFTKRTMLFWRKNLDATCPMETMFVRECFQTYDLGVCSYILRLLRNIWCVCKNDNAFTK